MAVAVCLCGCKTSEKNSESDSANTTASQNKNSKLTETKWMLTHLNMQEVNECPESPYIVFSGDRISGNLGCNTFFGTFYASKKGKIDIEYTGSTKKLCNEMQVERDFISALKVEKKSYVINGNVLIIKGEKIMGDGTKKELEILRFKAEE